MEMPLNITIEKLVAKVRLAPNRSDNIHAFGELLFYEENSDEPIFKIRGFTIRLKEFESGQKVLTVVFPAFRSSGSKSGYQTSFISENKSLWSDINDLFLKEFSEVNGGLQAEEIDLDKISKEIDSN